MPATPVIQCDCGRECPVTNTVHALAVGTFAPILRTLSSLLDKGAEHAAAAGQKADTLAAARLAPDMFPLSGQVRVACREAVRTVALLTGHEAPAMEEGGTRLADLKDLIARSVVDLESVPPAAFDGAEQREVTLSLQQGMVLQLDGLAFLRDWALPQFYFHVVTAYDILRHHGVAIGKRDYMRHAGYAIRRTAG